ncbi:MAG: metallophosphoesterase [Alistipes sp.]|nr:metallophosphoesterase [Alistipes sp.]
MDRKEFLATMAAIGGVALVPSASASVLREVADRVEAEQGQRRVNPSKTILMGDIHISGDFNAEGKPKHYPYNPICFEQQAREILAMRELPANLIILGDVAWDHGLEEDYRYAAELFKPLQQAGIRITMAMGNHDRRAPFFSVFEDHLKQTRVAGRVVSVVELPEADFVVLDSLDELPNLKRGESTKVDGEMDQAQIDWLAGYLAAATRPVILGAHHPLNEMPNLEAVIAKSDAAVGYIYAHLHIWNKGVRIIRPKDPKRMVPAVCLPSTFYGDIGYAVMHTSKEKAVIEYSSNGFWWPQPVENPPKEWAQRQEDLAAERCTILF